MLRSLLKGCGTFIRIIARVAYDVYFKPSNAPGIYGLFGNRGTIYIGSSMTSVHQRLQKHASELRRNTHHNTPLQNAVNSGEQFSSIMLEHLPCNASARFVEQREQYWIECVGSRAVNIPNSVYRAK
jgi:Uri superfamily endonuclease